MVSSFYRRLFIYRPFSANPSSHPMPSSPPMPPKHDLCIVWAMGFLTGFTLSSVVHKIK
jgi:hypothetical protein